MEDRPIRASEEIRAVLRLLVRPPFVTILGVSIVLGVAAANIGELIGTDPSTELAYLSGAATIFFEVAAVYLQIATILAAGGSAEGSGEAWVRAALRHRCFWRFVAVSLVAAFLILLGAVALVVGAVMMASAVVLSQPAVVLERLRVFEGLRRSSDISRPARKAVGIVFAVLLLPPMAVGVASLVVEAQVPFGVEIAIRLANTFLAMAAAMAFTRIFVRLGGAPTPPLQTLLYKANAGTRR